LFFGCAVSTEVFVQALRNKIIKKFGKVWKSLEKFGKVS
jgi:hypothetical protein